MAAIDGGIVLRAGGHVGIETLIVPSGNSVEQDDDDEALILFTSVASGSLIEAAHTARFPEVGHDRSFCDAAQLSRRRFSHLRPDPSW